MSEPALVGRWIGEFESLLGRRLASVELLWDAEHPNKLAFKSPGVSFVGLSQLLRDEELAAHLQAWPRPEDLWLHRRDSAGSEQALAIVRGGELWLVTGGAEEAPEPDAEPESFLQWFERCFCVPFPLPELAARMLPVGPDLWATRPLPEGERIDGFPHRLRLPGDEEQVLVGFAGYGCNSWACYFTLRRPGVRVYLRMPYGGAYMENDACAKRIAEELRQVEALVSRFGGRLARLEVSDNMGSARLRYRVRDDSPSVELFDELCGRVLDRAEEELQRALDAN